MLKDRDGGTPHSSGTNVEIPRYKRTVQDEKRRELCSSERINDQRIAAQPYASRPQRNRAGITGRIISSKRCRGCLVLGGHGKLKRMVPSGVQVTPTLTDTDTLNMESCLEPDSDGHVISQKLKSVAPKEDGIATIDPTTKGRTRTPQRRSSHPHMIVPVFNQVEQRIRRETFGPELTVVSTIRASVDDGAASGNDIGAEMVSIQPTPTKAVVNRAKSVSLKGEIGIARAELVCLDTCVGLLKKGRERIEQTCTELESVLMTWKRQRSGVVDSRKPSQFCYVSTGNALLMEVCMFHLAKLITTENMGSPPATTGRGHDG